MASGEDSLSFSRPFCTHHTHPSACVVESGQKEVFGFHAFPHGCFGRTWWHDTPVSGCEKVCDEKVCECCVMIRHVVKGGAVKRCALPCVVVESRRDESDGCDEISLRRYCRNKYAACNDGDISGSQIEVGSSIWCDMINA